MAFLRRGAKGDEQELDLRWFETEISRSRRHNRPLSALVLTARSDGSERRRGRGGKISPANLAAVLAQETRRSDYVVASAAGHVLVVAPETKGSEVEHLARRVAQRAENLELNWGVATFPNDGVTLDELRASAIRHSEVLSRYERDNDESGAVEQ